MDFATPMNNKKPAIQFFIVSRREKPGRRKESLPVRVLISSKHHDDPMADRSIKSDGNITSIKLEGVCM